MRFLPQLKVGAADVHIFVNDEMNREFECFGVKITYYDQKAS